MSIYGIPAVFKPLAQELRIQCWVTENPYLYAAFILKQQIQFKKWIIQ